MRQLRACDFCGDDAAGVYEPLPPELAADQHRVALCGPCRETLESVLAPLERDSRAATIDTDGADATDGTNEPDGDTEPTDDAEPAAKRSPEPDPGTEPAPEPASANDGKPEGFRKAMRLLNNRSFPLERSVAVEVTTGAYEFSESEAGAILEYAIEEGVLSESNGKLHRG
jgi:hypothetical protein